MNQDGRVQDITTQQKVSLIGDMWGALVADTTESRLGSDGESIDYQDQQGALVKEATGRF